MATTRTPGITILTDDRRFIDKRYLGVRIGLRVGAVTQQQAEERLDIEIARVQCDLARKAHARPTFTDCAARYVAQSRGKRSIDVIKWHVRLLQSYIGDLESQQIHDQTLESFVKARLAGGASATTINRSLEVVRTILNRAARSYRDADGRPWLEAMPPLITMLSESPRSPYPITWKEQDTLFRKLPAHLGRMALFAVNTGLRDSNVCGLPVWVFPFRGRRINHMNNSGPTRSHGKKGAPGFARQVLEFYLRRADRWIRGPTTVPQQGEGLGFRRQVLENWRARQDLNPRPPGS
jgi:hypothetical protein